MRIQLAGFLGLGACTASSIPRECNREGQIAFTFDQGPSQYTGILLSTLAKAGIKATFHVIPDYLDNPVLSANLRRAATDGHLIGLFIKDSITEANIKAYLTNATVVLKQYINYAPQFLRFPAPGPTPAILKLVTGLGYRVTSYNLDSQDYNALSEVTETDGKGSVYRTIRGILDQIVPPTLGSFVCVQRDLVQASVLQTPAILAYAKARGYKAVKLDACIGTGDIKVDEPVDAGDAVGAVQEMGGSLGETLRKDNAGNKQRITSVGYTILVMALELILVLVL